MWFGGLAEGARDSTTANISCDGHLMFFGGFGDATHQSVTQLFLDAGPPVISCSRVAGASSPHKLGFFGATDVIQQTMAAINADIANIVDASAKAAVQKIVTLLTNYGLGVAT
jgi:hypothetical protein